MTAHIAVEQWCIGVVGKRGQLHSASVLELLTGGFVWRESKQASRISVLGGYLKIGYLVERCKGARGSKTSHDSTNGGLRVPD